MVLSLLPAALGVGLTLALAAGATRARALTPRAGAVAAGFGAVVVVVGGFPFLALLVLFVVASVLATRFEFDQKQRANVSEGVHGERGVSNVLAHVLTPASLVVVSALAPGALPTPALTVLFTAALAFGASDTFASEFGVLSGRARSILSFLPVPPGTNGGVSVVGEAWAAVGALLTSATALLLFHGFGTPTVAPLLLLAIGTASGFAGCQVDSVLGETLENRGWLSKGSTNLLSMVASTVFAAGLLAGPAGAW